MAQLKTVALTCSLKASPEPSSTDALTGQVLQGLEAHGVATELIRVADYNVLPGVETDMGTGDAWPKLRQKILEADIFILATPTWVGHMSSFAQRVIERLDAELSDGDDEGRLKTYGKVALAVVVGNEDGAHKITADIFQALGEVGFTIPAQGSVYWNGEAMHKTDYKDLKTTPEAVESTIKTLSLTASHLAGLLKADGYPSIK
ncbi:MAG TPA: flavodoxin family protein [Candidatus Saccharimonadales bacterium]|nr:flavodoxin family protein [Candidatus Saccharimonadales bacterium]